MWRWGLVSHCTIFPSFVILRHNKVHVSIWRHFCYLLHQNLPYWHLHVLTLYIDCSALPLRQNNRMLASVMAATGTYPVDNIFTRLQDPASLVAVGLSVVYETWPLINWHNVFVNGSSKSKLGLPQSQRIVGLPGRWESPLSFNAHWQSLPHL